MRTRPDGRIGSLAVVALVAATLAGVLAAAPTAGADGPLLSIGNRVFLDDSSDPAQWAVGGGRNDGVLGATDDGNLTTAGIQDPGIGGVVIELLAELDGEPGPDGPTGFTAITSSQGYYQFSGVSPGSYYLSILPSNFQAGGPLNGLVSSFDATAPGATTDLLDGEDDGVDAANLAVDGLISPRIDLVVDGAPTGEEVGPLGLGSNGEDDANSDYTVDFGFTRPPMSLGNQVFLDDDPTTQSLRADGRRNGTEPGIEGVELELARDLNANGSIDTGESTGLTDTTDASGFYLFDNLPPGNYVVAVPPANFEAGGALENTVSSRSSAPGPIAADNGIDNNDNGRDAVTAAGITSSRITLAFGSEPAGETPTSSTDGPAGRGTRGAGDRDSDLTVDFGFFTPMSLGNRVWIDDTATSGAATADDGVLDAADDLDNPNTTGETAPGARNVSLRLYRDLDGDGAIDAGEDTGTSTSTSASGAYLFSGLPRGKYLVAVESSNRNPGGPLAGFRSSGGAAPADDDVDGRDKGIAPVANVAALSPTIELSYTSPTDGDEATQGTETDPATQVPADRGALGERDDFSNLTVDFGFARTGVALADDDQYATGFQTTLEVSAPGVLDGDTERDGGPLTATLATPPANGTVELDADGSFTYTPDDGFLGDDSFTYTATGAGAPSASATVTVTVADAPPVPTMIPGAAAVVEGDSGTTIVEVPVTLSKAWSEPVSASWSTRFVTTRVPPGQAFPGADYVAASGTVTFAPGETEATIPIEIVGDAYLDPDEWFAVVLRDPTNAQLGGFFGGVGFGGILDDDQPITIVPGSASVAEGQTGTTTLRIPVTLDEASRKTVTAKWATGFASGAPAGQALAGEDYEPMAGTLTFAPGETTAFIEIAVVGDMVGEPDEYVVVFVNAPVNARMGGFWGLALGGISNDDLVSS